MRANDLNEVYAELLRCQARLQALMLKHMRKRDGRGEELRDAI